MTKFRFTILVLTIAAIAVALWAWRDRTRTGLLAETATLHRHVDELTPLAASNANLSNELAQAHAAGPLTNAQAGELERLASESAARKNEIEKRRATLAATPPPPLFQMIPGSNRFVNIPKESWSAVSYATPENALQTMLWATAKGDLATLRASLTPDEISRRVSGEWKGKSDPDIVAAGEERLAKATDLQILNIQMFSEDQAHFTIYLTGVDHTNQPLWLDLRRVGGEWKSDGSDQHR